MAVELEMSALQRAGPEEMAAIFNGAAHGVAVSTGRLTNPSHPSVPLRAHPHIPAPSSFPPPRHNNEWSNMSALSTNPATRLIAT